MLLLSSIYNSQLPKPAHIKKTEVKWLFIQTAAATGFVDLQKKVFLKVHKFHRKTPVMESLINKAAGPQTCNLMKKILQHCCFPVKFATFL